MDRPVVNRALGLHMWPEIPTGTFSGRAGVILASTTKFEILIQGKGGHAAMPHLCADPIVASAALIQASQTLIARLKNPFEPAVISFTGLTTPSRHGVIPDHVLLLGTIRALEAKNRDSIKHNLIKAAETTARIHGCTATYQSVGKDYPETRNHPKLWEMVNEIACALVGAENVFTAEPLLAGEDFSFYGMNGAETCFVNVGCRNESQGCIHGLHSPLFKVDEQALSYGAALHATFALSSLNPA